jgi:hypothetical protein
MCWNVFTERLPSNASSKSVTILMITSMDPHKSTQKYNPITNSAFHEKFPDDDPAGSKRVANVRNKRVNIQ